MLIDRDLVRYGIVYALGRSTFAPTTMAEVIRANLENLTLENLKDISGFIDSVEYYGMECDERVWVGVKSAIDLEIGRRDKVGIEDKECREVIVDRDSFIYTIRGMIESIAGFTKGDIVVEECKQVLISELSRNCSCIRESDKELIIKDCIWALEFSENLSESEKSGIILQMKMSLGLSSDVIGEIC